MSFNHDHHPYKPYNQISDDNGHSKNYIFINRILHLATIALLVVTLLLVLLQIYIKFVVKGQARRRVATDNYLTMQEQLPEPPKTGLDPSIIASLPIFVYKRLNQLDEAATIDCAVCLSTLEEEDMARVLPNCNHTFHMQCIDMWLSSQSTCPICRTGVEPCPQLEPNESGAALPQTSSTMDSMNSVATGLEATSQSSKVDGSVLRFSEFRRILSGERSEMSIQPCEKIDGEEDLERQ